MKKQNGILLLNVGTPDGYDYWSVKNYLSQFLMDKRILEMPYALRFPLVHFFIAPIRAWFSAQKYREIWRKDGSPLLAISHAQLKSLRAMLNDQYEIALGMRYGSPSIPAQIDHLLSKGCQQIIIVPLLPQYSSAASGSALQEIFTHLASKHHIPSIKSLAPFYKEDFYIDAKVRLIKEKLTDDQHLILSFHGLPMSHIERAHSDAPCQDNASCQIPTDNFCYRAQCFETAHLIASRLKLNSHRFSICFQSRLGQQQWIKPYLLDELLLLRKNDVKNILIACPAFVSDCLETLHEIGIEAKAIWKKLGGSNLNLVSCINTDEIWLQNLAQKIEHLV